MDLLTLIERFDASRLDPVYLLHGPERFFIDRFIADLKAAIFKQPMADFNYSRFKAKTVSGAEIVAQAREVPMMAKCRLLVVDDGHKLSGQDLDALDLYMADPVPETCLVVVGDKFDLRRGPFLRANRRKQVHKSEAIKESQILPFLRKRAEIRGVSISPGGLSALAAAIGPDCAALDDGLERLGLYVGFDRQVTEEDVSEVVTAIREHSVFELVDAVGNRAPRQAFGLLKGLLANRQEPIMINAVVARHIRQLLKARIHLHQGAQQQDLARLLGVPPFVVNKIAAQARRFRGAALEQYLARLAHADYQLKSSRRPPSSVLEEAILDLCLD